MVFTDLDSYTLKSLCTLAKISQKTTDGAEALVHVGQQLGVSTEETLAILDEWEEHDLIHLKSEEEKQQFVQYCFSHLSNTYQPTTSELRLYQSVVKELGLASRSSN